ncbi:hypothetical protein EYF80_059542 [Liparis tanakae]|uniref:Uncharacterized protein n=1 Tax=Liparis tanakae TaxID=230148 RepID=A0A4Z2ENF0_9TELE|nr:hypothetical protein EYF80_059542 [Liparis tanakae]
MGSVRSGRRGLRMQVEAYVLCGALTQRGALAKSGGVELRSCLVSVDGKPRHPASNPESLISHTEVKGQAEVSFEDRGCQANVTGLNDFWDK